MLSATSFVEVNLSLLNLLSQSLNIYDKLHILVHIVIVILFMQSCHLLKFVSKLFMRIFKEFFLCSELVLDIFIDGLILLLRLRNIGVEILVEGKFQLIVVINILSNPVDLIAESTDKSVIPAYLMATVPVALHHQLLLVAVFVHCQTKA